MNQTDETIKHPLTKLEELASTISNTDHEKLKQVMSKSYYDLLKENLPKYCDSYKQLENIMEIELTRVKYDIHRITCDEKRIPEDELFVYQSDLIRAKHQLYDAFELFVKTLEKRVTSSSENTEE